jgi:hypothetical protein
MTIELSRAEALVLFELLARYGERGGDSLLLEHPAERWVLAGVLCLLEKQLVEPFSADYKKLLSDARAELIVTREGEETS